MAENQRSETSEEDALSAVYLDKYEKAAVLAMLIRQIRFQNIVAEQEPIKAKAEAQLTEAKLNITKNREALRSFGFTSKTKLWDQVKLSIGEATFNSAFSIAKQQAKEEKEKTELPSNENEGGSDSEGKTNEMEAPDKTTNDSFDSEEEAPKIRDLIIDQLKKLPPGTGSTSTSLRNFLEGSLNIDMHEKTVGMTLYRLSKDGIVRREGRNWFYVSKPEKTIDSGGKKEGPQVEETGEPS